MHFSDFASRFLRFSFGTCTYAMLLKTLKCPNLRYTTRVVTLLHLQMSDSASRRPSGPLWPSKCFAYPSPQALPAPPPLLSDSFARPHRWAPVCIYKKICVKFPPYVDNSRIGRKNYSFPPSDFRHLIFPPDFLSARLFTFRKQEKTSLFFTIKNAQVSQVKSSIKVRNISTL